MSGRARLVVAALIALFAVISYFGKTSVNPITGETQRVAMTPESLSAFGGRSRMDRYVSPAPEKPRHWMVYGRLGVFNFQDYVDQSRSEGTRFTFRRTGPKLTGRIYIGIHREF